MVRVLVRRKMALSKFNHMAILLTAAQLPTLELATAMVIQAKTPAITATMGGARAVGLAKTLIVKGTRWATAQITVVTARTDLYRSCRREPMEILTQSTTVLDCIT